MRSIWKVQTLVVAAAVAPALTFGATSISSETALVADFTGYTANSGAALVPPTDWEVQGFTTGRGTNQATGTSGGWYGNANLSYLGSGSAGATYATWVLHNNTGAAVEAFDLGFNAQFHRSGSASPQVTVSWSTSSDSTLPAAGALTNALPDLSFMDSNFGGSPPQTLARSTEVTGINIPDGHYLFLRFAHPGGTSSDNLGWDDVSVQVTTVAGSTWITDNANVVFDDGGETAVDSGNGPFAKSVTLTFSGPTTLAQPTVNAPFALTNNIAGSYDDGDSVVLNFTWTPGANDGAEADQVVTVNASVGTPASRNINLSGETVKETILATFKSEAEGGTAGTAVYKITGLVSSNSVRPGASNNWITLQDGAAGSASTRGVVVHDPSAEGKGASSLPAVGKSVTVYGSYLNTRGQVQIVPDRPYVVSADPAESLTPYVIPSTQLGDSVEGVLLQINNATVPAGTYNSSPSGVNITCNDGADFVLRLQSDSGITLSSGGGARNLIGIGGQFNSTNVAIDTGGNGYQLYARDLTELPVSLSGYELE